MLDESAEIARQYRIHRIITKSTQTAPGFPLQTPPQIRNTSRTKRWKHSVVEFKSPAASSQSPSSLGMLAAVDTNATDRAPAADSDLFSAAMHPGFQVPRIAPPTASTPPVDVEPAAPFAPATDEAPAPAPAAPTTPDPASGQADLSSLSDDRPSAQHDAAPNPPATPAASVDDVVRGMTKGEQDRLMNSPAGAQAAFDNHVRYGM
jgi:hypothetical protein